MNSFEYPSTFRKFFRFFGRVFLFFAVFVTVLAYSRFENVPSWFVVIPFLETLVSIFFFYMARTSGIRIENDNFVYHLFTKKIISFSDIEKLFLDTVMIGRYKASPILALHIQYSGGKNLKMHIETFENFQKLLDILKQKTRKEIEVSASAKEKMHQILASNPAGR